MSDYYIVVVFFYLTDNNNCYCKDRAYKACYYNYVLVMLNEQIVDK